jgi:nucleoside phosphorylase
MNERGGTRCDLLVLAAFPPELAAVRAALGGAPRARLGSHEVMTDAVGVGLASAAAGATAALARTAPRAVLLVGTCGAYAGLAIGDVAVADRVVLADAGVARDEAAYPEPMLVETRADTAMATALVAAGGVRADVATTLSVTTSDALAAALARATRCAAEHLEAHGVAVACAAAGVPFACALGVANAVGSRGRAEWRANHVTASEAAARVALRWIESARL